MQTKLFKPALRSSLVTRTYLIDRLNAGLGIGTKGFVARLILVCAPAGFGKTTLVCAWLAQLATHNGPTSETLTAWLSLDDNDNDPVHFLAYLTAALQTAVPYLGQAAEQVLQSPQPPPIETILTLLINEISQNDRSLILVLDDYHVITTPAIHQALTFLLEHLPSQLHLLLTTRSDPPLPLSRLRARGQVVEVRANDLRFQNEETGQFLNQVMGLNLDNKALSALEERTEGWIAGLQLAAVAMQSPLSAQRQDDLAAFITSFTGSHRFVLDYLTDEVLERRPKGTRQFLLQTAMLDRFCASLCDALTKRQDSHAVLEQLEQANLFLIPLDDQRHWYRYHHLFAELLHKRLQQEQPDLIEELHRRAFAWYAKQGLVDDALGHALAADDLTAALALVAQHAWLALEQGDFLTVRAWLARLPATHLRSQSELVLIDGFVLTMTGQVNEAEQLLQETVVLWTSPTLPSWQRGELAHLRALLARVRNNTALSQQLTEQALNYLPVERPARRSAALLNLLIVATIQGDNAVVEKTLGQLTEPGAAHHKTARLDALHAVVWSYTRRGQLTRAAQLQRQILQESEELKENRFVALGFAYTGLGIILYEQNDLVGAIEHLNKGIAYLHNSIEQIVMAASAFTLAQALLAGGDIQGLAVLDEADAWMTEMHLDNLGFKRAMATYRALLDLRLGNLDGARQWLTASDLPPVIEMPFYRYQEYLLVARIHLAQHQWEQALAILDKVEVGAASRQMSGQLILIHCLRAVALHACGDTETAIDSLTQALTLAEPEGYSRSFVDEGAALLALLRQVRQRGLFPDYIDKLLAAFPLEKPTYQGKDDLLPDPLSDRELEILRLVATGASNQDIADQLVIALSTAKKHVSNMLVKLDAPNRTQAAARARELGLLP